jgi:hypothetical protein
MQTVKITPGMQAKELLSKVCKRAGAIEMSDHYLHLKSTDSEVRLIFCCSRLRVVVAAADRLYFHLFVAGSNQFAHLSRRRHQV